MPKRKQTGEKVLLSRWNCFFFRFVFCLLGCRVFDAQRLHECVRFYAYCIILGPNMFDVNRSLWGTMEKMGEIPAYYIHIPNMRQRGKKRIRRANQTFENIEIIEKSSEMCPKTIRMYSRIYGFWGLMMGSFIEKKKTNEFWILHQPTATPSTPRPPHQISTKKWPTKAISLNVRYLLVKWQACLR